MCEIKTPKSCGCSKKINESIQKLDDKSIIIKSDNPLHSSSMLINRQNDGTVTLTLDKKNYYPFDNISEMTAFMGNDSERILGSKIPKEIYFLPENIDEINNLFKYNISNGLNEVKSKKITIIAKDNENTIVDLLNVIKTIGNTGHGFDIEVDKELKSENDEDGLKTSFYWDGDGSDRIEQISIEEIDDEDENGEENDNIGYLTPGVNESVNRLNEYNDGSKEVLALLIKHYKLTNKLNKKLNGRFTGFSKEETTLNKDAQNAKNKAWDISRKGGIDTTAMMGLDKEAKIKTGILKEASKVNLKLSSNVKRDLIKKAKTALDAIYAIYDITERLNIDAKSFVDNLDGAFESTNDLLTLLVTQESIEKK